MKHFQYMHKKTNTDVGPKYVSPFKPNELSHETSQFPILGLWGGIFFFIQIVRELSESKREDSILGLHCLLLSQTFLDSFSYSRNDNSSTICLTIVLLYALFKHRKL